MPSTIQGLSDSDLELGAEEIKGATAVTSWIRHGKPVGDIEMEVDNIVVRTRNTKAYQVLRDRVCSQHSIDEHEFVRQLFQWLARPPAEQDVTG